ncbi:MAG TPA: Ig-like domain-containing protein [Myxococcota bacterium]|nr:Ig-like domain-containing protein [Myxococcota bacterium]
MIPALLLALACGPEGDAAWTFPDQGPALRGPGAPDVEFSEDDLFETCAFLTGTALDIGHHNLLVPYGGHLVMPWAPEWGRTGGLSLFDMSDPCAPVRVGDAEEPTLRETHAMGFAHIPDGPYAGDWAVANYLGSIDVGGVEFWDLGDPTAPRLASQLDLDGFLYPDAYARVSLSVFWQYPYAFVAAAENGVFVVDATDPTAPAVIAQYVFDNQLRAGQVSALGGLLLVSAAEGSTAALLDVSVPDAPALMPGSPFQVVDRAGEPRDAYFANLVGSWALFARKEDGGGPIVMDLADPTRPAFLADLLVPGASGGYVFYDEGFLFVGGSSAAQVVDARDLGNLRLVGEGHLPGDLDTITPYGNVALLSVDEAPEGAPFDPNATAVMPWAETPDLNGPLVLQIEPRDGATGVPITARIGVGFNEIIEPMSAYEGAIRLYDDAGEPVRGWTSAQEAIASYAPREPLLPDTTYRIEVAAGGVADPNGNTIRDAVTSTFKTAP